MRRFISRNPDKLERVPLVQLVPNMVTLSGMCFGLTSIRFAMEGRFQTAVFLILLSAVMDGLDGLLARRLQAMSKIGAQLDSLSDFLCFGVAPAILVYQMHLMGAGSIGWIFALIFAAACCLRLARFNVTSEMDEEQKTTPHFVGVPAPAGAMLGLLPVFLTLADMEDLTQWPILVGLWMAFVALLMISELRTLSPKGLKVPRKLVVVMMFAIVISIGMTFTRPWQLFVAIDLLYLAMVTYSLIKARGRMFG